MRLGLGCVGLGSAGDRRVDHEVKLLRTAVDLGVTVFDTADVYGGGASEHVLGKALRGRRDEVTIATKGGFVFRGRRPSEQWARRRAKALRDQIRHRGSGGGGDTGWSNPSSSYAHQDFSPRHLREAVHASLRRLGTDRIDVYQLHAPDVVLPDLLSQLADLVAVGDVVRFGVGAGTVAAADGWLAVDGVRVVQVPFGVLDPEAAATTLPLAREASAEVWVRGVLGGGLLGIAGRDPAALAGHPKRQQVAALLRIASDAGLDPYQLAFGYVRARADHISTVLVGTSSPEHLERNLAALAADPLPGDVQRALSDLATTNAGQP